MRVKVGVVGAMVVGTGVTAEEVQRVMVLKHQARF